MNKATGMLDRQLVWDRLLAIVEEQAQVLMRTAFSTVVREAGDLSAGVFSVDGDMLAQAVTGTPGHVNAMAASVGKFLKVYPAATLEEGDVLLTNDPWDGTGHLNDFTVVTPVFRNERCVALFASTSHIADVGGRGFGPDANDLFEEGLRIPISPLFRAGKRDETLMRLIKANVRDPVTAEGDLHSLTACNELGGQALNEMLDDFKLADLTDEARFIIERSRQAMIREISALPDGEYDHEMVIDGYREPVRLKARLRIHGERLSVDFAGSSSRSEAGINVPLPYTEAYASFGVRCIVGNEVPNNAGSLAAITVTAPEGSILNAPRPSAVSARHSVGQMLPDVVLGCLAQVVPEKVPAEGASCIWNPVFMNAPGATAANLSATPFVSNPIFNGGTGARAVKDGLSTTAFPSGVRTTSTEINEATTPLVIWRKEYRPDSGGPGTRRGGLGQTIELGHREGAAFVISKMFDRILHPARGRFGGGDGMSGSVHIKAGAVLPGKGRDLIPAGETLVLETPGGGGIGPVNERPREAVRADLAAGLISREAATAVYGYSEVSSEDSDEELRFPADSGK